MNSISSPIEISLYNPIRILPNNLMLKSRALKRLIKFLMSIIEIFIGQSYVDYISLMLFQQTYNLSPGIRK